MQELEIAICNSEERVMKQLSHYIQQLLKQETFICKIDSFISGQKLFQKEKKLDIVFIDIEMTDLSKIEIGNWIRKIKENCKVLVAIGKANQFKEAFRFRVFWFLAKPVEIEAVKEMLDAYQDLEIGDQTIKLYQDRNLYNIVQKQIRYIVAYDSYTEYLVGEKKFRQNYSLNQLEPILDSRCFYRVNRQYIVNLYWILGYKDGVIYIENIQIDVSRRRKKEFEKFYLEFGMKSF